MKTIHFVITAAVMVAGGGPAMAGSQRTAVLQPGSQLVSPVSQHACTGGFMAKDRAGALFMILGSDCAPYGSDGRSGAYTVYYGSRSWQGGAGPAMNAWTKNYGQRQVGRFVAQHKPQGDPFGYSIMRLDRGQRWSAVVPILGPTAAAPLDGTTTGPDTVTYVCSDGSGADIGLGTGDATYDSGVRDVVAPTGIAHTTFRLAEAANAACEGAPVVLNPGDGRPAAVGFMAKDLDGQVVRINAVLADARSRFGFKLQFISEGSGNAAR
jgi:hypothetical protein